MKMLRDARTAGLVKLRRSVRRPGECLQWAVTDAQFEPEL
jgi:hypothetical protein